MKLILVNIGNTFNVNSIMSATKEAWLLKRATAESYEFVVAVAGGNVIQVFKKIDVDDHSTQIGRVRFKLDFCNLNEENMVKNYIDDNSVNLKYFVTKYLN